MNSIGSITWWRVPSRHAVNKVDLRQQESQMNEPLPPQPENFKTKEEFEEAQNRWRWTVGRNQALRKRALQDFQQPSK